MSRHLYSSDPLALDVCSETCANLVLKVEGGYDTQVYYECAPQAYQVSWSEEGDLLRITSYGYDAVTGAPTAYDGANYRVCEQGAFHGVAPSASDLLPDVPLSKGR